MNIESLINNLPNILIYFVPGYVALNIRKYYKSEKQSKDRDIIILSLTISFIIKMFLNSILQLFNMDLSIELETITLLFLSILFSLLWYKIYDGCISEKINKFLGINIDNSSNVWNATLQNKDGLWGKIYFQDQDLVYEGKIIKYTIDPEEKERELLLSAYAKYNMTTGNVIELFDDEQHCVLVNCKNVDRIEIVKD